MANVEIGEAEIFIPENLDYSKPEVSGSQKKGAKTQPLNGASKIGTMSQKKLTF